VEIKPIHKNTAILFIHKYHYSKILPRLTKWYLGYYENDELVGIITLGWGTQPLQTIQKIFYKDNMITTDYFEIGKMCFRSDKNGGNFGSQAIKLLLSWVRENTNVKFIYTLADGIMGKCGIVYQAANFKYIGSFKTDVYMDRVTGEKIHPRSAKQLCKENAQWAGVDRIFWLTHSFCEYKKIDRIRGLMFRYMYPLSKESKKILKKYDEYSGLKNPKEADLIFERRTGLGGYERINKPEFNMNVFNHNYQKFDNKVNEFFDFKI